VGGVDWDLAGGAVGVVWAGVPDRGRRVECWCRCGGPGARGAGLRAGVGTVAVLVGRV